MSCGDKTVSSNLVKVSIAKEQSPKVLPASPIWYDRSLLGFPDFGAEIEYATDDSINASRQNQRGTPVGISVVGGFDMYMTNQRTRDLQGFFFADAHEKPDTSPLNGPAVAITGVDGAAEYTAGSGLDAFAVGSIVLTSGFSEAENNDVGVVTASSATDITTDGTTVAEVSPPAAARIQQVGFKFSSDDLTFTINGGTAILNSAAGDWFNVNVNVGEWIFIGGDDAANRFAGGYGYGRVLSKTNNDLVIDEIAWVGTLANDTGTGKTVEIYFGTFLRNEKNPDLIKCNSYQIERRLGNDANGVQSQYEVGMISNELSLTLNAKEQHTCSLNYVGLDEELRTGLEGVKAGTHVEEVKQSNYNTSSDVFRIKMSVLDDTTLTPTDLFAFGSEFSITVSNNASVVDAVGCFGGLEIIVGNFVVGGSVTAYFSTVESIKAIRDNKDVGVNVIIAQNNKGIVYDIPLLGVGGGKLNIEKDSPITVPIEKFGAENANGYTMSYTSFDYLPDIAMPSK